MHHVFHFQQIEHNLASLLESCSSEVGISLPESITIEIPKDTSRGHLASSIALRTASQLKKKPLELAKILADACGKKCASGVLACVIEKVEVAHPGFINFYLKDSFLHAYIAQIVETNDCMGAINFGDNKKTLIEFVSANPTGPLSIAHARQAVVGDSLARVLSALGFDVSREYYNNDEGNQINILGKSLELRYRQLQGEAVDFPEECYQGDYLVAMASELHEKKVHYKTTKDFSEYALKSLTETIETELSDLGVRFDVWYSQKQLGNSGKVEAALESLREKGFIYDQEGAVWFKSTAFGDDKDRVVIKSDKSHTYLAPDIAYHDDKFKRGFEWLINIWGPDHHGYIPRIKAAVQALGYTKDSLDVIIVQLATIYRDGKLLSMSTRKGQYITLREVLTEVGRDAMRFFLLMRRTDSHLDFDLELAKKQTPENPVYYIQYAHARTSGILENAKAAAIPVSDKVDLACLREPEEKELMLLMFEFAYVLEVCLHQRDPYALTMYLQALAASFHRFYDRHRILGADKDLMAARLVLVSCLKIVFAKGLDLLGVCAPSKM